MIDATSEVVFAQSLPKQRLVAVDFDKAIFVYEVEKVLCDLQPDRTKMDKNTKQRKSQSNGSRPFIRWIEMDPLWSMAKRPLKRILTVGVDPSRLRRPIASLDFSVMPARVLWKSTQRIFSNDPADMTQQRSCGLDLFDRLLCSQVCSQSSRALINFVDLVGTGKERF